MGLMGVVNMHNDSHIVCVEACGRYVVQVGDEGVVERARPVRSSRERHQAPAALDGITLQGNHALMNATVGW